MNAISPSTLRFLRNALSRDLQRVNPVARPRRQPPSFRPCSSARLQLRQLPTTPTTRSYASASSSAAAARTEQPDSPPSSSSSSTTTSPQPTQQPPKTHYDLFRAALPLGPPPSGSFTLDPGALRREFLRLQAQAHPDRHPGALKARAEAASARINDAYRTLQDPLRRAQYLLALRGVETDADEAAKLGGGGDAAGGGGGDAELLGTVMEVNEAMEEADGEDAIRELKVENDERVEGSVAALEEAFKEDDLVRAKREAVRLRYWMNIKEGLHAWEKGKGPVLVH